MTFFEKICNFFKSIFSPSLSSESTKTEMELTTTKDLSLEQLVEENTSIQSIDTVEEEDRINVAKRTLMSRLYMLEQEISFFEEDFPEKYKYFLEKIEKLRSAYQSDLKEIQKLLTFEIDPESNYSRIGEVVKLEKEIKRFLETEVKFDIISKRLQRLIIKLNILYNVSIFHSKESEKEKVISQLKRALESAKKIAHDFKNCEHVLHDTQLKERIVSLISYVDYEIFKSSIRNSNQLPNELIEKLIMTVEFDEFDYASAFKAFAEDEITDLGELFSLVTDCEYRKVLKKQFNKILSDLMYSEDNLIVDFAFWNNFFDFENKILEILKVNGVDKERAKVGLIDKMDITIDESDVLVSPKTNTYLSFISIFSSTHDKKIVLMMKLLKNLSDNVTYKEIYFLLLLFDALEVVQNTHNDLVTHIEKYLNKYPYSKKTIMQKKECVKNIPNKEYVVVFILNDYEDKEIITTLEELNIDFKVVDNKVFINSFYFSGLSNVLSNLQLNTKNTI